MLHKMHEKEAKAVTGVLGLVFNLDGVDEGARPHAIFHRKIAYRIAQTHIFEIGILTAIVINTIILASTYFPENDLARAAFVYINYILTGVFTAEMLTKIIAFGIINYVKNPWNQFDATIVIVSLVELCLPPAVSAGGVTTVFRALRLLRILRLLRTWTSLRHLLFAVCLLLFTL
jgi:hypothetical protein